MSPIAEGIRSQMTVLALGNSEMQVGVRNSPFCW